MQYEECFYVPGNINIIDYVGLNTKLSVCCKENLDQIQQRYPTAIQIPIEEAREHIIKAENELYITYPKEITEDRFNDMLGILPPMNWRHGKNNESFMMIERITSNITSIYVRINNKYWTFDDRTNLTHEDILHKTRLYINLKLAKKACCICGGLAYAKKQWYNRDNGYSICPRCVAEYKGNKREFISLYGYEGIHYNANPKHIAMFLVMGPKPEYKHLALFNNSYDADAYIEENPGVADSKVFLADYINNPLYRKEL